MLITRAEIEQREALSLAPYAARSGESRGRAYPDEAHPYRTAFQKDRDRIVHTAAFRRLQYKTQVLLGNKGDYHRTRLTHTLETSQIARTVARTLGVNEDLTEAIAFAHDLGHPPFGHAGEDTLDELMKAYGGFNHNIQTFRIVEQVEQRYPRFPGLNLTWEVREGIAKHGSAEGKSFHTLDPDKPATIETQIIDFADEIAYVSHDLDDGIKYGYIDPDGPKTMQVRLWREAREQVEDEFSEMTRHRTIRHLIDHLATDLILATEERLQAAKPRSVEDVWNFPGKLAGYSTEMDGKVKELKKFLLNNFYLHPEVEVTRQKGQKMLSRVFEALTENAELLPPEISLKVKSEKIVDRRCRIVCDYIAGMTDRFLVEVHNELFGLEPELLPFWPLI